MKLNIFYPHFFLFSYRHERRFQTFDYRCAYRKSDIAPRLRRYALVDEIDHLRKEECLRRKFSTSQKLFVDR